MDAALAAVGRLVEYEVGEVAAADAALGSLLDSLAERGWLERAVIAVVSDHGEEFGEHDGFFHARTLHGESLWVPLLIVDGDNRLRFRTVRVLRRSAREIVVDAGLENGDRICLTPLAVVSEGMPVRFEDPS